MTTSGVTLRRRKFRFHSSMDSQVTKDLFKITLNLKDEIPD